MITEVEFGDRDKVVAAIEQLKRALPAMLEYQISVSKIIRARYLALVAEGFLPSEALAIVKEMYK